MHVKLSLGSIRTAASVKAVQSILIKSISDYRRNSTRPFEEKKLRLSFSVLPDRFMAIKSNFV